MSTPKRHHFVPESYLSGFTENESGFLHLYSKRTNKWRRQKPDKVMVRNKYYRQSWVPDGVDQNILEKRLGQEFEPKGMRSLEKLITSPETTTDDDSANILAYLEFQRFRVPRQAEIAKALMKTAIEMQIMQDSELRQTLERNQIVINDSFRFEYLRMVNGSLIPYMARMVWDIVRAEEGASFITSDSPVTFFNVNFPPPLEPGIACYGTMVLFPINSSYMLVMRHPEYFTGEKRASEHLPRDLDIEDGYIEIHKDIVWDQKAVDHHNGIIYILSQDLIAGNCKDAINRTVGEEVRGQ